MADFYRSLARAMAVHVVTCACCNSEHVAGNYNDEGLWYGYCLTCGCHFWDRPPAQA